MIISTAIVPQAGRMIIVLSKNFTSKFMQKFHLSLSPLSSATRIEIISSSSLTLYRICSTIFAHSTLAKRQIYPLQD